MLFYGPNYIINNCKWKHLRLKSARGNRRPPPPPWPCFIRSRMERSKTQARKRRDGVGSRGLQGRGPGSLRFHAAAKRCWFSRWSRDGARWDRCRRGPGRWRKQVSLYKWSCLTLRLLISSRIMEGNKLIPWVRLASCRKSKMFSISFWRQTLLILVKCINNLVTSVLCRRMLIKSVLNSLSR